MSQKKFEPAETHLIEALETNRKLLGMQHPQTAYSMNNLASLYQQQGKVERAEPLLLDAHSILLSALGKDHPVVISIEENMVELTRE